MFVIIGVGWYVAVSMLAPFAIGLWLDKKKFNSFPLCSIIGLGLGTMIMIYGVYRMVQQFRSADDEQNKEKKGTTEKTKDRR